MASVAIPSFVNYQLSSKQAEAFVNLSALANTPMMPTTIINSVNVKPARLRKPDAVIRPSLPQTAATRLTHDWGATLERLGMIGEPCPKAPLFPGSSDNASQRNHQCVLGHPLLVLVSAKAGLGLESLQQFFGVPERLSAPRGKSGEASHRAIPGCVGARSEIPARFHSQWNRGPSPAANAPD